MPINPYIGEIYMFGGNFAPIDFAFCNGQLLPIASFEGLFSVIGTTYGGDGSMNFAVPDLRARFPLHAGPPGGFVSRPLGQKAGDETVALSVNHLPAHNHVMRAFDGEGDSNIPTNAALAKTGFGGYHLGNAPNVNLASNSMLNAGGNQAHPNMPPYLAINFIIAVRGTIPLRN